MNIADVVGSVAACLSTIAFLPQVIKTIKSRSARDFSMVMLIVLSLATLLWFIYGLMVEAMPIILANAIVLVLVGIILIYKLRFG